MNGCLEYQLVRYNMPFETDFTHFWPGPESVDAYKCKQWQQTLTKELCNQYSKEVASSGHFFRSFIYLRTSNNWPSINFYVVTSLLEIVQGVWGPTLKGKEQGDTHIKANPPVTFSLTGTAYPAEGRGKYEKDTCFWYRYRAPSLLHVSTEQFQAQVQPPLNLLGHDPWYFKELGWTFSQVFPSKIWSIMKSSSDSPGC